MRKCKHLLLYLAAVAVGFYLLPFAASDTGGFMLLLLFAFPLLCFVTGLLHAFRHSFSFWFAVGIFVLFLPCIPLHYNSSAWGYAPAYALIALAGSGIGCWLHKKE